MSHAASDTTLSTFTASDGDNLALQDWPLPEGLRLRGVVLLVHGLGEHAGRYDQLARRLNGWGFAVRGYDQYGHGESDGVRGALPVPTRFTDDLADVMQSTRKRMEPGVPLILFGHSMGGLVTALLVAMQQEAVDGLVLSSPALDPGLNSFQKLLLATLPRVAPNFTVGNGLDPDFISHDPDVVAAYRRDPRVHDRISGRLARFIADGGPRVIERAPQWTVPTLLMYAGQDKLVNSEGSRAFAAAAPDSVVRSHCFTALFHEIFHELDAEPVYEMLKQWLDERF
ncbi:alpha/beta hydrolase [Caenimonas aquaedulcis]|uniref:Lysophospholipase n=1 Tax=Caenimonas aquaedulcis TaxID=2793270 RepID=A0A931H5E5_9BURK|nr:alpha/beta hydrolase [Caenimonas aquaedulcis]MBG9388974.1 lysophospholipase [Caenimonas aquaedulcis]